MILEDVTEFLREVAPLSFLAPARLTALARATALEYYPSGTAILGSGGAGEGFVHVLKKGRVRFGAEMLTAGAIFGQNALDAHGSPSTGTNANLARAEEDAVCYLLPPEALERAVAGRADVADMLQGRFTLPVLEMGLAGLSREMPAWLDSRPLALVTAGEAARGSEGAVPEETSIELTAEAMQASGMNALVVLDGQGRPSGVVTDTDFRTRALGMPPSTPVKAIMTSPVLSVDAAASCFDALLTMTRHCLRHVVVLDDRRAVGLVSAQELLLLRVGSPPALAAAVAAAPGLDELAAVAARLPGLALGLLREGARAGSLGRIAGGLRERLVARLAELAEERLGPPPVGYCLMLLGPAARRDGPALTPGHGAVWTGIIHEDAPSLRRATSTLAARPLKPVALTDLAALPGTPGLFGSALSTDEYFQELGSMVAQGLAVLGMTGLEGEPDGYPPVAAAERSQSCDASAARADTLNPDAERSQHHHGLAAPAGVPSVGDDTWRGGLAYWKGLYAGWIGGATPLPDPGLLDFRPVHGQLWLSEALRAEVGTLVTVGSAGHASLGVADGANAPGGQQTFLVRLGQEAGEDLPALLRMLALSAGVPRIGSVERAEALGRVHPLVRDMAEETVHAMEYLAARQWLEASGPPSPLAGVMLGLCRAVSRRLVGRLPQWFGQAMHEGRDGQVNTDGPTGRTAPTGQTGRSRRSKA